MAINVNHLRTGYCWTGYINGPEDSFLCVCTRHGVFMVVEAMEDRGAQKHLTGQWRKYHRENPDEDLFAEVPES